MAKTKKERRPRAETPKGFRDYFGAEVRERTEMLTAIAGVYHRYGFEALESSAVETVEALGKFLPDVERPNAGVFAWQEDEGEGDWLALRYDLTAPLARVYAQHPQRPADPPIGAMLWGRSGGTKSRGRDGFASSINAMPTRWAARRWPRTPRYAPCWPTRWRRWASRAATT